MRGIRRSLFGAGREREGERGAGIELEFAIFLPMGEESDSGVDGEELRGSTRLSLPHVVVGLQSLKQNGKGGGFNVGGWGGESRETDFERVVIDLDLTLK